EECEGGDLKADYPHDGSPSSKVDGGSPLRDHAATARKPVGRSHPEIDSIAPREAFLAACADAIKSGDLGLAKVAHVAQGALLDLTGPGAVAELSAARRKRGER
ncbi:MAG: hypothetical protein KC731_36595, partial [Myxococcales bacterium]|nr:hypothetical protein [Myxococcales bacterium]